MFEPLGSLKLSKIFWVFAIIWINLYSPGEENVIIIDGMQNYRMEYHQPLLKEILLIWWINTQPLFLTYTLYNSLEKQVGRHIAARSSMIIIFQNCNRQFGLFIIRWQMIWKFFEWKRELFGAVSGCCSELLLGLCVFILCLKLICRISPFFCHQMGFVCECQRRETCWLQFWTPDLPHGVGVRDELGPLTSDRYQFPHCTPWTIPWWYLL